MEAAPKSRREATGAKHRTTHRAASSSDRALRGTVKCPDTSDRNVRGAQEAAERIRANSSCTISWSTCGCLWLESGAAHRAGLASVCALQASRRALKVAQIAKANPPQNRSMGKQRQQQ
eukprot:765224-Hanusia_phi.AAC.3